MTKVVRDRATTAQSEFVCTLPAQPRNTEFAACGSQCHVTVHDIPALAKWATIGFDCQSLHHTFFSSVNQIPRRTDASRIDIATLLLSYPVCVGALSAFRVL